jgi:hypothetical protein
MSASIELLYHEDTKSSHANQDDEAIINFVWVELRRWKGYSKRKVCDVVLERFVIVDNKVVVDTRQVLDPGTDAELQRLAIEAFDRLIEDHPVLK